MINLGNFVPGNTLEIPFTTQAADGAAINFSTTLEAVDIVVFKDGVTTVTTTGVTVLTNPATGLNMIQINTATGSEYTGGSRFHVGVSPSDETVDGVAAKAWIATFTLRIKEPGMSLVGYSGAFVSATVIQFPAAASATEGFYNGHAVWVAAGTGLNQLAIVEAYVGSTKRATVRTLLVNLDATSFLQIYAGIPGAVQADIRIINGVPLIGAGVTGNLFRV